MGGQILRSMVLAAALGCTISMVPATAQSTCAWFEGEWGPVGDGPIETLAEGPVVVMLQGFGDAAGRVPTPSEGQFALSILVAEEEVAGTVAMEAGPNDSTRRLVFVPNEPLSGELEYELLVTAPVGEFGFTPPRPFTLEVVEASTPQPPMVSTLTAREELRPTDEVCCDLADDDPECQPFGCVSSACNVCWFERNTYPVVATVQWDFEGGLSDHYDFVLVRTDGSDEESVGTYNTGAVPAVSFDEEWEGDRCVRVDAVNAFTGDVVTGEEQCIAEFTTLDRVEPAGRPASASSCVSEAKNTGTGGETADDGGGGSSGAKSDSGCSSVSADAGWLSLLLLGLVRLRQRRPRSASK